MQCDTSRLNLNSLRRIEAHYVEVFQLDGTLPKEAEVDNFSDQIEDVRRGLDAAQSVALRAVDQQLAAGCIHVHR